MNGRDPIWPVCGDCPARAKCRPVAPAPCRYRPDLFLIGEAPGQREDREGKAFVGESGVLLRASLQHGGYDSMGICFDNACRMPFSKDQATARHCILNAIAEVRRLKPKLVVALGAVALDALTFAVKGKARRGIMLWEGLMVEPASETFPPIAAIRHPAAIIRSLGVEPYWSDLIKNLRKLTYKPSIEFDEIKSANAFAQAVRRFGDGMVTIDYETTGLEPRLHEMRSVALTGSRPWGISTIAARAENIEASAVRNLAESGRLVAQNAHFEAMWTYKLTGVWPRFKRDTMIAAYFADENAPKGLSYLVRHFYPQWAGYDLALMERVKSEKKAVSKSFADVPFEELLPYNAGDARTTYELAKDIPDDFPALERMLLDAAMVFARLEYEGVQVDLNRVAPVEAALEKEYARLAARVRSHKEARRWERDTGREFNVRSRDQVAEVLHGRRYMGLRSHVKTKKTGKPSTDKKALKLVAHPIVKIIKEAREVSQRNSTFVTSLPTLAAVDGRVHPSFSVAATVTGQIACSRPNLMNIKKLPEIRGLYVPSRPDGLVVSADYSQSQLGLLGMFAHDERIIRAYKSGEDMHAYEARLLFDVEEPTKAERDRAKTVNYAILFGKGTKGLAEDLECSERESEGFIDKWFTVNAGAARFVRMQHGTVQEGGVVESVWKQLRRLPAVWSTRYGEVQATLRQAVNFPIANADRLLTLWAMIRIDRALRAADIGRVMLEMHDSVSADLYDRQRLRECVEIMYRIMVIDSYEELSWMQFPMRVDISYGEDWSCPEDFEIDKVLKDGARSRIIDYGG